MNPSDHDHPSHDIGCLEAIEELYAWLDGERKDPQTVAAIEDHISHCQSCYSRAEMEQLLTQRIREVMKPDREAEVPDDLHDRMRKLIDRF